MREVTPPFMCLSVSPKWGSRREELYTQKYVPPQTEPLDIY
jgi:hypothetical protein